MHVPRITDPAAAAALWRRLAALALALPLAACALNPMPAEADFGDPVRVALAQQHIAPGAAANRNPVAGLDGRSALGAMDNYDKSFAVPVAQPNVFKIGFGDGK